MEAQLAVTEDRFRMLVVVAGDDHARFALLTQILSDDETVDVIVDRRSGQRRQRVERRRRPERRQHDRRAAPYRDALLSSQGWAIVSSNSAIADRILNETAREVGRSTHWK